MRKHRVRTALLLLIAVCHSNLIPGEQPGPDSSQLRLPWGTTRWDDFQGAFRKSRELEKTVNDLSREDLPWNASGCKFIGELSFVVFDDSKNLFLAKTSISWNSKVRSTDQDGTKSAIFGQVFEKRGDDVVFLRNHPRGIPPKDSVGLFTIDARIGFGQETHHLTLNRHLEDDLSSATSPKKAIDQFPKIEITVHGAEARILSPQPDDGKPFEYRSADGGFTRTHISTVKVDDIIETTYFKFKVHSIVMPDEKEQISGWINIKLLESKPVK